MSNDRPLAPSRRWQTLALRATVAATTLVASLGLVPAPAGALASEPELRAAAAISTFLRDAAGTLTGVAQLAEAIPGTSLVP